MAPKMIEEDKVYIPSQDHYIWLCRREDGSEWATYLSKETTPDSTVLGWYTQHEDQARKDFKFRVQRGY